MSLFYERRVLQCAFLLLVTAVFCSCSIQQRRYRSGLYVHFRKNLAKPEKHDAQVRSAATLRTDQDSEAGTQNDVFITASAHPVRPVVSAAPGIKCTNMVAAPNAPSMPDQNSRSFEGSRNAAHVYKAKPSSFFAPYDLLAITSLLAAPAFAIATVFFGLFIGQIIFLTGAVLVFVGLLNGLTVAGKDFNWFAYLSLLALWLAFAPLMFQVVDLLLPLIGLAVSFLSLVAGIISKRTEGRWLLAILAFFWLFALTFIALQILRP